MSQRKWMEIRSAALGIRRVGTVLRVPCTSEVLAQIPGEVLEHRQRTVVHHKMFFFLFSFLWTTEMLVIGLPSTVAA
ncbi:hypothetical protein [Streptomyces sp. NPDC056661]|uniref:hypothetical protein n=1 Tax=Streptomyces sp. NPDC056661 TaxID=3345898 RepID=UPI0036C26D9E